MWVALPMNALSLVRVEAAVHGRGQAIGRLTRVLYSLDSDVVVAGVGMTIEVTIDREEADRRGRGGRCRAGGKVIAIQPPLQ